MFQMHTTSINHVDLTLFNQSSFDLTSTCTRHELTRIDREIGFNKGDKCKQRHEEHGDNNVLQIDYAVQEFTYKLKHEA